MRKEAPDPLSTPLSYHLMAALIFLFCIAFSYGHTTAYPFQFDDFPVIVQDPDIRNIESGSWSIKTFLGGIRPVAKLSFAVNYYLGGSKVQGYHLVNLLIHFLNTFIIYLIFLVTLSLLPQGEPLRGRPGSQAVVAGFAALLWAVHPVQTQAVTYIVQRIAALAAFFYLFSLYCYILGRLNKGEKSMIYFALAFLFALLAFGTKENTLLLPFTIALYEIYFIERFHVRFQGKQIALFAILAVVLALGLLWVSSMHQEKATRLFSLLTAEYGAGDLNPFQRVITEWRVLVFYLTLLLFPIPLRMNLDHDFTMSVSLLNPVTTLFSLLLIVLMAGYALWQAKKQPLVSFSIFWFFINLAIESSFIKLDLVFEHRLYLSSVMFFLPLALMIFSLGRRIPQFDSRAVLVTGTVLVVILMVLTYERNKVWQSETSLWTDVVSKSPRKIRGFMLLGTAWLKSGNPFLAIQNYKFAVDLDKNYPKVHNDLGGAYQIQGNVQAAIKEYQEAIRLDPGFAEAHFNLGNAYELSNQNELAFEQMKIFLDSNPGNVELKSQAYAKLGKLYSKNGNRDRAIQSYRSAIELNKKDFRVHHDLGTIYQIVGMDSLATDEFRQTVQLKPDFPDPHFNLGTIYLTAGQNDLAILELKEFLKLRYAGAAYNSIAHTRLGILYIRKKDIPSAQIEFEESIRIDPGCSFCQYNYGYFLEVIGKREEAKNHYRDALKSVNDQKIVSAELILNRLQLLNGRSLIH